MKRSESPAILPLEKERGGGDEKRGKSSSNGNEGFQKFPRRRKGNYIGKKKENLRIFSGRNEDDHNFFSWGEADRKIKERVDRLH